MTSVRHSLDRFPDTLNRQLITLADGSYTNSTVLKQLPDRITFIGRIRKDAKLHFPLPDDSITCRLYGPQAPTPDEILNDDSIPTQSIKCFIAGKLQSVKVKTVTPLFWRKAGHDRPLRLVVIKPLGYRLTKASKILYRQPAFLICTDIDLSLDSLIQAYIYRWEIECNHRDEKSYIGVAQGQVWSPLAVTRLPQFQVAAYSLLLLASLLTYGFDRSADFLPLPKWRSRQPLRPSILDLLNLLRSLLFERASLPSPQPDPFASTPLENPKSSTPSIADTPFFQITPSQLAAPSS